MLLSIALLVGVLRYPPSFTESLLCPNGMTLDEEEVTRNRSRKNQAMACRNQAGETLDVTGRLLMIFLVPFSASLLLLIFGSSRKPTANEAISHRFVIVNFKSER